MKNCLTNFKYIALGVFVSLTACVSDDLAEVGDLEDITGPTPFFNITDVTTSSFDCNDVELSVDYDINFQAGSNLAVNGTSYEWSVTPSEGVDLININLPILERLIDAQLATVIAIEDEIAKREFRIPCEEDPARVAVFQAEILAFQADLAAAQAALSDETLQNIADLESQIANLEPATLQDRELIFSFPNPGDYSVSLTVTDNLDKSDTTDRIITVLQAVPSIPIPEIGEASFEENSLFDGTGDGRDSWRVPSNDAWSPVGGGTTVIQINTDSNGVGESPDLPDGVKAAKFTPGGERVAYQEIDVTPGAEYVLSYFTAFEEDNFGDIKVSILNPNTSSFAEAQLEANIIASRVDTNVGRVDNVFKKHAITFAAGENESVIIFATNTGVESRMDAFEIVVNQ